MGIGNRIAMRIDFGTAEHLVHSLDQSVRDDVFELFRLVVHLVPAQADHLHQKQLDQTVSPDHECRRAVRPPWSAGLPHTARNGRGPNPQVP